MTTSVSRRTGLTGFDLGTGEVSRAVDRRYGCRSFPCPLSLFRAQAASDPSACGFAGVASGFSLEKAAASRSSPSATCTRGTANFTPF